jgi:hypothetical protein
MNIRAAKSGLRVHEVPSLGRQRVRGATNLGIVADGADHEGRRGHGGRRRVGPGGRARSYTAVV